MEEFARSAYRFAVTTMSAYASGVFTARDPQTT
jgi:hypothetical protein